MYGRREYMLVKAVAEMSGKNGDASKKKSRYISACRKQQLQGDYSLEERKYLSYNPTNMAKTANNSTSVRLPNYVIYRM